MTTFAGFHEPEANWSKLPHEFIDAFPLIKTRGEALVILYVLRHTWGFGDSEKHITMDEFVNGRKRKDGTRLDHGTGLTEPTIRDGLVQAIEHGFLTVRTDDSDQARIKHYYALHSWQGERNFPPEVKKFTPSPQETLPQEKVSLPRSEKETYRKKPLEETNEIAIPENPEEEKARSLLEIEFHITLGPVGEKRFAALWEEVPIYEMHRKSIYGLLSQKKRRFDFADYETTVRRISQRYQAGMVIGASP